MTADSGWMAGDKTSVPSPDEGTDVRTFLEPFTLSDGTVYPATGLGTFGIHGPEGVDTIASGLAVGYRLLDTASGYRTEEEVGEAIRRSLIPREQIRVTSKLRGPDHAYDRARQSIRDSRARLGGAPIDLYLIHWPNPRKRKFVEAWHALIDARAAGDIVSIGTSNFERPHLEAIIDATGIVPAVNQIELHPHFPQPEMRALNASLGIQTESWSPLGLGSTMSEPVIASIADEHAVTAAQVVLRWHYQLGCITTPRSSSPRRQTENLDVGGFTLTEVDMVRIGKLGRVDNPRFGRLWGGDPATEER